MNDTQTVLSTGQVSHDAAVIYERFFVPALFRQWVDPMLQTVGLERGRHANEHVLDLACGTGVLTRAASECVADVHGVVGLDPNQGMLAVAAREAPRIEWRLGHAESLPWNDASFDVVLCQFGLMFFEDRAGALREAMRVLRPRGRLAVAVWCSLDRLPGFAQLVLLLDRICGREAADALRAPFSLGDPKTLAALFVRANVPRPTIREHHGRARFPSLSSWIETNVRGWAFSDLVDDARLARLIEAAHREMGAFVEDDGTVSFAAPALIASTVKD